MAVGSQWSKLVAIILVGLGAIVLAGIGRIDGATASTLLAAILGYVFGNGHGIMEAKRASDPTNVPAPAAKTKAPVGGAARVTADH